MEAADLDKYVDMHIKELCSIGFTDNGDNHCAHFVSHVLGFRFGFTCGSMVRGEGDPASIRVQEVFARCPTVGAWEDLPGNVTAGLVFITNGRGVDIERKKMENIPRKHVGIFCGTSRDIWHYSNSRDKVVRQTPQQFARHYPSPYNAMFWGSFPVSSGN